MAEPILEVTGLTKFFGAVAASDALTFAVERGSIHGLIGPNGAGKSTTIAQLSGEVRPDAGRIRFAGADITDWPVHRRAHAGLQRSYQITSLFPDFTAAENVALAVQARQGHSFRFLKPARGIPSLREPALAVLGRLGLAAKADLPASRLGHGEQRQLELAMVLATRPTMLLLDEPTAGMSLTESQMCIRDRTSRLLDNAHEKRRRKGCDWILANDVSAATGTFGGETNEVHLITAGGTEPWPRMSKDAVAERLALAIAEALEARP